MPVVYREHTERGWLLLWEIAEREEELADLVSPEDVAETAGFGSRERRRQRLAWRAALRSVLPQARIGYEPGGGPVLLPSGKVSQGGVGYIGVSHTDGIAAVIYDPESPCAVDVERLDRRFGRIASRYLSEKERELAAPGDGLFEAVCWCAKETLYKYARREGLSLSDDLRILRYGNFGGRGTLSGSAGGGKPVPLSFFTFGNCAVVYTDGRFFGEKSAKCLTC